MPPPIQSSKQCLLLQRKPLEAPPLGSATHVAPPQISQAPPPDLIQPTRVLPEKPPNSPFLASSNIEVFYGQANPGEVGTSQGSVLYLVLLKGTPNPLPGCLTHLTSVQSLWGKAPKKKAGVYQGQEFWWHQTREGFVPPPLPRIC